MKKCSKCGTSYDARINFCFRDGSHLGVKTDVVGTPRMVTTGLAGTSDPVDMMQTLDNINLDDLLQIGQSTPSFSGFDFSLPMEAPASKDGDTLNMSRSELLAGLSEQAPSSVDETDLDLDTLDFELDMLSDDIDAHLEDTLDGVQVGQLLNESSLDFSSNASEIQPGDTLDLIADELGLPEATESDIRTVDASKNALDDFDQWEASGPVMQEAAREALKQRQMLHEEHLSPEDVSMAQTDVVSAQKSNRSVLIFGVAAIIVGFIGVLMLSNNEPTINGPIKTDSSMSNGDNDTVKKLDIPEPTYKKSEPAEEPPNVQPVVEEETPKTAEPVKEVEEGPTTPSRNAGSESELTQTPVVKPIEPTPQPEPKKVAPPPKPKTYPKPMPKKDKVKPVEKTVQTNDNETQAIGWGDVSTCELMIRSNISSALVYINGSKRGKVGTKIPLDCTNYAIEVRASGYITTKRQVALVEDATFTMNLER